MRFLIEITLCSLALYCVAWYLGAPAEFERFVLSLI